MDEKRIAELREFSKDFQRGTLLTGVKLRIAEAAIHELLDEVERYKYAIYRLSQWTYAYPLVPFPEPDFEKAKEILEANGMTLDRISASNMRHVLSGVKNIIAGLDVQ